MTLIGNEFLKLRTVRGPWILAAVQQVIIIAGISGLSAAGAATATGEPVRLLYTHAGVASAVLSLVIGITAITGEHRHKTITDTYLGTPSRARVVSAKLIAYTLLGAGLGVISAAVGLGITTVWAAGDNLTVDMSDVTLWRIAAGIVAMNALYAAIGVSLGALMRNMTAAIATALVWIALAETTVANLVGDSLGKWLPNRAGMGLDYMPTELGVLPQWGGGVVLAAYTALFMVAALATTVRRDVT